MTKDETVIALRALTAAFPRKIDDDVVELWGNVFADTPMDRMMVAVKEWVTTAERFPTPAQLKGVMRDHARRREMDMTPDERQAALPAPPDYVEPETGVILSSTRIPTVPEGLEIGYRAYVREVKKQGREPKSFDEFRGKVARRMGKEFNR